MLEMLRVYMETEVVLYLYAERFRHLEVEGGQDVVAVGGDEHVGSISSGVGADGDHRVE
jgi:hypothetical protein